MKSSIRIFALSLAIFLLSCKQLSFAAQAAAVNGDSTQSDSQEVIAALKAKVKTLEKLIADNYDCKRRDRVQGPPGRNGIPGVSGKDGQNGLKGVKGEMGSRGYVGLRGSIGPRGFNGYPGPKGEKGATGRDSELGSFSVTYTRWGRTSCPAGAELVYKGRVGGEHYTHTGGGANYQCLPDNPIYDMYYTGRQGAAYMYNAEYQVSPFNPFSPNVHYEDDVPCAICRVKRKSSLLVIPARNVCPTGWRREYYGYLMTEGYNHAHPRDFICVDRHAEAVPGTRGDKNGALLYFVDGKCGGHLQCGPYKDNAELTCAVCSI